MLKLFQTPYTENDFPPIEGEGGNDDFAFYLLLIIIIMFVYFALKQYAPSDEDDFEL